ncbi:MAG TPA: CsbD family protein [Pirellulales bacterium]|nr:CsbD family protein [Pirellulales bacterium]
MSGKTDVAKGRIKEAAGALTGNEKLRADGQTDQAVGEVKQSVQKAADKVEAAAATVVAKAKKTTK